MIEPKDDGRVTAYMELVKLGAADDVAHWKELWADWLAALDLAHP